VGTHPPHRCPWVTLSDKPDRATPTGRPLDI
jgi:hypothetical protein